MTNQEIIDAGQVIFDEESVGANTSERVGAVIKGIGQNLITEENARTQADTDLGHRIDDEETARLAAESGLGGEIDAEALARQNADTALGGRINTEKTDRENADTALGERIDDLSDDLADEIQDLQDAISSEESTRQSAVNNLGDAINAEALARQNADTALGGRINTEKTDRENADTALGGRINTEKTDRENADTALGERIDDLSGDLADEVEARQTAITNEETARQQADLTLGGRIDAEKSDRETADGELGTRITGLSDDLAAEVSAREADVAAETAAREAAIAERTKKQIYKSIFQSTATGSLIPRVDGIIKELYLSLADIGNREASKFCLQNIRRNVSGTWYVNLYYYDNGAGTQALRFNSVKKTGELEIIRTSNESYCVIDWSLMGDGENIYVAPGNVGDYLLEGDYVSDVDNFPISKDAGRLRTAEGNIARNATAISAANTEIDTLSKTVFPYSKTPGRFIKSDGSVGIAATAQVKNWCMTGLIPLSYFVDETSIMSGVTEDIVLKNTNQRYASNAPRCLFYDENREPISGSAIMVEGDDGRKDLTLSWSENIPEGAKYVVVNFVSGGYVENLSKGGGESESVDDAFIAKFNKFAVSWIDDDFKITEVSGAITENYPVKVKDMCDEMGCKCDFAVIPSSDKSWGGDNYPTDDHQFIPDYKIDIIKSWQHEGFHFQLHPIHKGWYSGGSQGYVYQGVAFCEQSLVKCMEAFNAAGVIYDQCIVYPGASGANVGVIDMVRRWLEFGFSATTSDKYNSGIVDSLRLRRLFLNFGSEDVAFYKAQIDAAVAAGAWVVIGTHSAQAVDDLDNPTSDTSALTLSNIKEVVQYANSKSTIRPIREVWNKRKMMLGLYSG